MSLSVKRVTFWRAEMANKPGNLARTLAPLAKTNTDLSVLMGYRYPGNESRAAVELYPIETGEQGAAAQRVGLAEASIPAFLISGKNRPGRVYELVARLSNAGINLAFVSAQAVGKKFSAVIGFENDNDLKKAEGIISKKGKSAPDKPKDKDKSKPKAKTVTKAAPKAATAPLKAGSVKK